MSVGYHRSNYSHRDPLSLRQETEDRIAERERKLDLHSDECRCSSPRPGPRYLKVTRCTLCARRIIR